MSVKLRDRMQKGCNYMCKENTKTPQTLNLFFHKTKIKSKTKTGIQLPIKETDL